MSHLVAYDCDLAYLPPVMPGLVYSLEVAAAGSHHGGGTMSMGKGGHLRRPANTITT